MSPRFPVSWLSCAHCSPYPVQRAGQSMRSPHLYTPSRIAAAAVIGLNDEPVGYWPNVARLKSGFRAAGGEGAGVVAAPFADAVRAEGRPGPGAGGVPPPPSPAG